MKKVIPIILILLLACCPMMTACSDDGADGAKTEKIKVKIATYVPTTDPAYLRYEQFCKDVNEMTGDAFDFTIYPSDQLGDWSVVFDELIRGNVELNFNTIPTTYDDRLNAIYMPYVAADYEYVPTVFGGDSYLTGVTDEVLSEKGIKLLGWDFLGFTGIVTTKDPLPEGFLAPGVKNDFILRSAAGAVIHNWIQGFGLTPMTVAWADVYSALQTGVVDGACGPTANVAYSMFRDVAKTFVDLNLYSEVNGLCASEVFWSSLTPEQQEAFLKAAEHVFDTSIENAQTDSVASLDKLRAEGVNIVTPTDEERGAIIDFSMEIWEQNKDILSDELVEQLKSTYQ